jgi:hypothetical protein
LRAGLRGDITGLTVLHVFENRETDEQPWARTPVAVEAKLPITELKHEGILCPMEISVCEGYPARQILNFLERKPHDLIIMGGRHHRDSVRGAGLRLKIAPATCCWNVQIPRHNSGR